MPLRRISCFTLIVFFGGGLWYKVYKASLKYTKISDLQFIF